MQVPLQRALTEWLPSYFGRHFYRAENLWLTAARVKAEEATILRKHEPNASALLVEGSNIDNPSEFTRNRGLLECPVEVRGTHLNLWMDARSYKIADLRGGIFETFLAHWFNLTRKSFFADFRALNTDEFRIQA